MKKNYFARLIFSLIICVAAALTVFSGCLKPDAPKYSTVKFEANGGSSVPSQTVESGKTVAEPDDPVRDGYVFLGWFEEGSDAEYDFSKAVSKDFTLYAKWETAPSTVYFTVTFMDGNTEYKTDKVESGKTVTKPDDPVKTDYTFKEWITADGKVFNFNSAVTSDLSLYASWTKNPDKEPENPDPDNPDPDNPDPDNPDPDNPDPDNPDPDNPDPDNPDPENPGPEEPQTKYFTVTFNSNQGSGVAAQYIKSGEAAAEPLSPTKTGYIFDGWYKEASLTNKYDFSDGVTEDLTLHAKWIIDNVTPYSVTFDSNGGSAVHPQEVTRGGKAVIPEEPEREGFIFGGWHTAADLKTLYNFDTEITSDITLYAKWTAKAEVFEVKFETDGGSAVLAQEVDKGAKAARPKDPTKDGFTFGGWYNGNSLYDFDAPVTSDLTLTAKWEEPTATPAASWQTVQADFLAMANKYPNKTKPDAAVTDGRFTYASGVYFEDTTAGLSGIGNINTQNRNNAISFELKGQENKNTISFKYKGASEGTISLYKEGSTDPIWTVVATAESTITIGYDQINDKAGEYTLSAGTYYLGSTNGSVRIGDLTIFEYVNN